jgi:flagellar biogenesis protein FliO
MNRGFDFFTRFHWVAAGMLAFGVPNALASATNQVASIRVEAPSLLSSLFRLTGALALVIALFLGGVWLLRNWQRVTVNRGRASRLSVLEVKSLGPRHALYVIGYDQQRFLLSSAPTGISMLASLPAAFEVAAAAPSQAPLSFADSLARVLALKAGRSGDEL